MDCSYNNVRVILDKLINLRKNSPQLISDVYAKRDKEILRCLEDVKISLCTNSEFNDCNIELNNPFDNLNMKQDELLEKICKQIQLLQILIKKKNCPVSEIIDEI